MNKYCTWRKSSRYTCGDIAVSPHPMIPQDALCVRHKHDYYAYAAAVNRALS